jgi:hypothetical protein
VSSKKNSHIWASKPYYLPRPIVIVVNIVYCVYLLNIPIKHYVYLLNIPIKHTLQPSPSLLFPYFVSQYLFVCVFVCLTGPFWSSPSRARKEVFWSKTNLSSTRSLPNAWVYTLVSKCSSYFPWLKNNRKHTLQIGEY